MPSFDLRGIKVAEYTNNAGTISYGTPVSVGDAMSCNLDIQTAEALLYAEGSLKEAIRKATGGSISIAVKYIPDEAQKVMYGKTEKTRTVGSKTVNGLQLSALSKPAYLGVVFYAPDMIDGVEKYTCVFVSKAIFGPPAMAFTTKGNSIQFQTPTTTGNFMTDDSTGEVLIETAVCDSIEDALAWGNAVLGAST